MKIIKSIGLVRLATMAAVILTAGMAFSQEAVTAKGDDLTVPPPSYAKFDAELTQTMLDLFNSPIMKAQRDLSAGEMGGYVFESLKISYFTTDKSFEDVTTYYSEKFAQDGEIETRSLMDPPEDMLELEQMTGLSWGDGYMEKYQNAYEKHMGEESMMASYSQGSFGEKMVSIEVESPHFDPGSFKKVDKTSIMYMVMTLKKK
jgi:hypothetical protein